ncbi:MAG TPA: 3-hydroxyacyl-CoA dehydrogenase NAD-binding domain-containing protein [Alphaproteobacteria bacterium]|nr:3-hydroxyacyl-CoA dehydrogenase NAD-binding domain-containing protein [Alphaproteobacteria bacterium]
MAREIRKVAVIGAGVMGAAIAAHVTNAGLPVVLLDIVSKDPNDRSAIANGAVAKMLKTEPAPFMSPRNAKLITPGNLEDDLNLLADCDWIVEAIIENVKIKHDLYAKLEAVRKEGSIVTSNTSTIPLKNLIEGRSEAFQRDFAITHFFNPPRYMRLLELVSGDKTAPDVTDTLAKFCDVGLGKGVVRCHDTPGFIANRIGMMWMQAGLNSAEDSGLTVEEADKVAGKVMGFPSTGLFGLFDLVGIDLMPHVSSSMAGNLPPTDSYHQELRVSALITKMIETGYTGRKGKGGFYRMIKNGAERRKEAVDLKTGEYHAVQPVMLPGLDAALADRKTGLKTLLSGDDKAANFAWGMLAPTFAYSADLVGEIADTLVEVDDGMKLGYGWKFGPFELMDQVGTGWLAEQYKAKGRKVPKLLEIAAGRSFYRVENGQLQFLGLDSEYHDVKRAEGVLLLADIKRKSKPLSKNGSASLWDIGDGVVCLEFHSKANALDPDIMGMIGKALALIGDGKGQWKALVVANDADNFSVGANLGLVIFAINIGLYDQLEEMIGTGQQIYKALKYAPFPVVSAPAGRALGGGCEITMHSSAVQAHAETYMGLVEVGVGVLPGWGGCKELLGRQLENPRLPKGPIPAVASAFQTISTAQVSKSAAQAKDLLYLRESDGITMNRDRLLADAKAKALSLVEGYAPPKPHEYHLPGATGRTALSMAVHDFVTAGKATPYDVVVSDAVAQVLTGGDTDFLDTLTEDDISKLERKAFIGLCKQDGTIDRIETMLTTGKPLRN